MMICVYLELEVLDELTMSKDFMPFKISCYENIVHNENNEFKNNDANII